jgi:predicted phage terminase large subunit-like protein
MQIAQSKTRFRVACAGRRFGKSRVGAVICIAAALQRHRAWWIAPNYPTAQVGWRTIQELAQQIPHAKIKLDDMRVTMPGGGWVQVRSAESPTSLRGEGLDLMVIDEAAHIPGLDDIWAQALRPALSDRRGGALFISTPKGHNEFYELYQNAETSAEWACWQFPTSANPHIAPTEIEAAKAQLPALVFRQEYGAEFVQLTGAMFRREYMDVIDNAPPCQYVRAWDIAVTTKSSGDYTCGALCGLADDGRLVIADMVRGRWEWPDAVKIIARTARSDGQSVVQAIETVGTQTGMLQTLMRDPMLVDIAFRPASVHSDKITRVMPWLARAEQGKLALVRGAWNAALIDECCSFPEGEHDDQVDAVSAACNQLTEGFGGWGY